MPYCAILNCKNESKIKNLSNGNVSYHRFPKDPHIKGQWIEATGRVNWFPPKSSTICSEHFDEKEITISKNGLRFLCQTAVPTHKIVLFVTDKRKPCDEESAPGSSSTNSFSANTNPDKMSSKLRVVSLDSLMDCPDCKKPMLNKEKNETKSMPVDPLALETKEETVDERTIQIPKSRCTSAYSTLREKKLCKMLRWSENKVRMQTLKIKRLQAQNRSLKQKIRSMQDTRNTSKENYKSDESESDENE